MVWLIWTKRKGLSSYSTPQQPLIASCRLFRTINIKVPIASLSFSLEGANIYLGTENGKLLILDLRALDKPPKTIVVSETGARLATMSVQVCSSTLDSS